MIPYFKSAPKTLTLWCPGVVVAVGWLGGRRTVPPSSPGPEQENGSGNRLEFAAAKGELSEVSQGDFPWLQLLPHKWSPPGCAVGALLLDQH